MKKLFLILLIPFFASFVKLDLSPIDVNESTLKIGGLSEEVLYFGFSEGDQIVFSFQEINGKELKEVEILEWPSSSKYMDYKTTKIENKIITVTKTGIYKFRFSNSAIAGRICKFKIQRIPATDQTKIFNTAVYWRTITDTSYTAEQEKYITKSDTVAENITDQTAAVHSAGNLNGNKTSYLFTLPTNTVAWSYYVGVDQAGKDAFDNATRQLSKTATPILTRIPGYGPLAALALGGASYLTSLSAGEDVDYYILNNPNLALFNSDEAFSYIKKGHVINDFSKMLTPLSGTYNMCLYNDNAITGISVTVKITAVTVTQEWATRTVQRMHLNSHDEPYLKS